MTSRAVLVAVLAAVIGASWTSAAPSGGQGVPALGVPDDPATVGYLNLRRRHPDGREGPEEFIQLYSLEHALERLAQVRSFLQSFRQLTVAASPSLGEAAVRAVGNTGGDMQTIGFHNIPLTIEGTILKQGYQLAQARYELAQLRHERGDIGAEELRGARARYEDATRMFQLFWDTKLPTD